MTKIITYGTFDMLHEGHINLLKRAKALGDYLIVGVTADNFDFARGKINVQQTLIERIDAVKQTGFADEVIVEEYEGQKIDDIRKYGIDIFTLGSDWEGKFNYLSEFCKVVYLPRTEGVSSSQIRAEQRKIHIGMIGSDINYLTKFEQESHYVNGTIVTSIFYDGTSKVVLPKNLQNLKRFYTLPEMLNEVDSIFIYTRPQHHYNIIKTALQHGKHVLCDPPMTLSTYEYDELKELAEQNRCILMEAIRTAFSTAYHRLVALAKGGDIGNIVSVDAVCTSLRDQKEDRSNYANAWNSICFWGPNALLPIFDILGTNYDSKQILSRIEDADSKYDAFTIIYFSFPNSVASIKVGKGMKSEGHLIISGTSGYIYVPAPWWKTDYFEVRREDHTMNKKYFYQLEGEGIRYEQLSFIKAIQSGRYVPNIRNEVTRNIIKVVEDFYIGTDLKQI